jgi:hypothetical protein
MEKEVDSMKKYVMLSILLLLFSIPYVMAGTGSLRISPEWPIMVPSPADFTIWCQDGTSYNVNILLIITESCYFSMQTTGAVIVEYGGSELVAFDKDDFKPVTGMGGEYVPPSGTTEGGRYTVASLKDHLDLGLSDLLESDDIIYWAMKPIFDALGSDPKEITITLNADNPRMLVYLLGKSVEDAELFDVRIPPTPSGFVVPEVTPLFIAGASFAGLALYLIKQRRQ